MNRWKIAFFALVALMVSAAVAGAILLSIGNGDNFELEPFAADGEPIFLIETSKNRLNYLIQSQLERLKYDRDQIDFVVQLDEQVNVNGYLTVFDKKLSFRMKLQPIVQENGNLLLKQQSFYIGELPIPSRQVLKFIRSGVNLPKWVIVKPEDDVIYLNLNEIEVSDNLHVKVNSLDLMNDNLSFEIYEPLP